jgi:glucose-1-phosphatase
VPAHISTDRTCHPLRRIVGIPCYSLVVTRRPAFVIFDMDDVLCHYDLGRRLRRLAALANTTARDVRAAIWDSGFEELSDAGEYPDSDVYLREFATRLGFSISREQWIAARREAMIPKDDVIDIVKALHGQVPLAIYTNNGPIVKESLDTLLPEAAPYFSQRFCSYEFGTKKPDPESFTRLARKLDLPPEDCWFIDDKKSNVEGARLAGLRAHHFRNAGLLRDEAVVQGLQPGA